METEPLPDEPRIVKQSLSRYQDALVWLTMSRRALRELGRSTAELDREIEAVTGMIGHLNWRAGEPLQPRRKPKFDESPQHQGTRRVFDIFLDESGVRLPVSTGTFDLFVVGAVVVEHGYLEAVVQPAAKALKAEFFGRTDIAFHEPGLRQHVSGFSFRQSIERQREFCAAYREMLRRLDFDCIAAVLDKRELHAQYGDDAVDEYLPRSNIYAMAYDFVLERACNLLYFEQGDGIGAIFPERSGKREDAELQLEHARLVTTGTRYVSQSWFQHQFRPGLRFLRKGDSFGTELADLVARTVADHYILGDDAACWAEVREKLFNGHMDRIAAGERRGAYKVFPGVRK